MKDISELPEGTEQTPVKATSPKPRSTPRAKQENQTIGSQEQETKPAPRRRTAAPANDNVTASEPTAPKAAASSATEKAAPKAAASSTAEKAAPKAAASSATEKAAPKAATSSSAEKAAPKAATSSTAEKAAPKAATSSTTEQTTPKATAPRAAAPSASEPAVAPKVAAPGASEPAAAPKAVAPNTSEPAAPRAAAPRPATPNTSAPQPQATYRNNNNAGQGGAPRPGGYPPRNNNGPRPPYNNQGGQGAGPRPYNNQGSGPNGPTTGPRPYNNQGNGPRPPYNNQGGPGAGPRPYNNQGGPGAGPRPYNNQGGPGAGPRPYNNQGGGPNGPVGGSRPPYRSGGGAPIGQGSSAGPVGNTTLAPRPYTPDHNRDRDRSRDHTRDGGGGAPRPQGGPGGPPRPNTRPGGNTGGAHGHRPGGRPGGHSSNRSQERRTAAVKEKVTGPISLPPQIVVKDLADMLGVTPIEVIRDLINKHAIFASINQVVDYEKASLVAQDLGFEPSPVAVSDSPAVRGERPLSANEAMLATHNEENMVTIPPVVTIMGHVDHGKTSLLDTIRKTKVAAGEAGGITQHIGAYQVEVNGKKITFLDTPGHEAFTAMRARGAQVTHIAIIVIAADDGVMPQTREAIDHARAAKVPIIIALNKIDKANANPDHVKQQLLEMGIVIEEFGGETVCVPISARRGEGIDELLDYILLVAEVQDIKANPDRLATGVIIEAKLEKNSGATATVLVQQGTLKMGDNVVVGAISGKVRAMFNDRGKRIQKATPSTPVSIIGLPEVPNAGDRLEVTSDERTAKQHAEAEGTKRKDEAQPLGQISLDTLYMQMQKGTVKELNVVIKSDVQGSLEAIKGSLSKLGEDNLKVRLIREGIGNISETDVHLAAASKAIIIGFNVKADTAVAQEAQREHVDIRYYTVIYKLIEDIQAALVGMLEPTFREVIDGHAEIMQTFKAGKVFIAGCRVLDGKITRGAQVRLKRKDEVVLDGKVASLRRGKDDVREVLTGYECGILLEDYNAYEVGDIIETYSKERVLPSA